MKKIGLIALVVVLLGAVFFAAGSLFMGTMQSTATEAIDEGQRFGIRKTAQACELEGFRRLEDCGRLICRALQGGFLLGCLERAIKPATYCKGVPEEKDIQGSTEFILRWCSERHQSPDDGCRFLAKAVQRTCAS